MPPLGTQLRPAWPIVGRLHNCHSVHLLLVWVWRSTGWRAVPEASEPQEQCDRATAANTFAAGEVLWAARLAANGRDLCCSRRAR